MSLQKDKWAIPQALQWLQIGDKCNIIITYYDLSSDGCMAEWSMMVLMGRLGNKMLNLFYQLFSKHFWAD